MPRLFIAIDLPNSTRRELVGFQPEPMRGIQMTAEKQLHLTLHFLGELDPESVIDAMRELDCQRFVLKFAQLGQFRVRQGGRILWAGLETNDELLELHRKVGTSLESIGYQVERRPYHPHITLARCRPFAPKSVGEQFREGMRIDKLEDVKVNSIQLYQSELTPQGPVYECLYEHPLTGDD